VKQKQGPAVIGGILFLPAQKYCNYAEHCPMVCGKRERRNDAAQSFPARTIIFYLQYQFTLFLCLLFF
jgi:hypothetical protein